MLEGLLKISVVKFSNLDSIKRRIDAEYYEKFFLELEKKISKIGKTDIHKINAKLDCSAFYPSITNLYNFNSEGVPFLRVNEIQNGLVTITQNTAFLPQFVLKDNPSTIAIAKPDDIVIAKGGNTLAKLGLVTKEYPFYAVCRDLIILRTEDIQYYNKYFLWVFLHSKYGQSLLWRTASQTGQPHLTLPSIGEIGLPKYSEHFENMFEELYINSIQTKNESATLYAKAEILLLEAIGLNDFNPSQEAVNIKNFKDSFGVSGRLDAEYYQVKYEEVMKHITSQNYATLKDVVYIRKSIEPGSDVYAEEGLPFLRVADYNRFGITEPDKKLSYTFCNENADLINKLKPKKGTILFSKDGSVGTAYMLRKDEELITSGAILHLNVRDKKKVIPEYLTLALNSQIVKMQSERDAGGSIILHWRISEIENVIVPIIDFEEQKQISELIEESFRSKKQSEQLLEAAKKAVEVAIEEGEERAMEWMYVNTGI